MAREKEVHFFDRHFEKGINWYKAFFPLKIFSKGKIVGEVTPRYIFDKVVPERCKTVLPGVKVIVLLRNPSERAYSHYNMTNRHYNLEMDFEEYVQKTIDGEHIKVVLNNKATNNSLNALNRGLYSDQIKRWLDYYPRENCLFLESEQFFGSPATTLKKINDFLGIEHYITEDLTPQNTGNYIDKINPKTRILLDSFFKESNDWLREKGVNLSWLDNSNSSSPD